MNQAILKHKPLKLWEHFEQLNAVPRASKKEARVIEFMKKFGEQLGLETKVDAIGNVIIRKPATPGMENRVGVVLQGHLDMVHQKNADTKFDFETQGIESWIDGGWLKARGTTLGSDNGVGVASIMAVLSSKDLKHGPIEALFTIDEETGMTGALELKSGELKGKILLNTDTEEEGELCIGCAGGIDTNIDFQYDSCNDQGTPSSQTGLKVSVTGLRGGHSGCDIHLGRGNANKIMNRLLWTAGDLSPQIISLDGGSLRNAIPRESFAVVSVRETNSETFQRHIKSMAETIRAELVAVEPDLKIGVEKTDIAGKQVMQPDAQQKFLHAIYAAPNGVIRMSDQVPGLVESSTSLARVHVEAGKAIVQFLSRSSVDSAKIDVANSIAATFRLIGAKVVHQGSYPGWKPKADSAILNLMKGVYSDLFGKTPHVSAVHAGLECGIIGSHYPDMDMISFGPTIKNPHSPDEKCEIETVEKYWRFLTATLERIP